MSFFEKVKMVLLKVDPIYKKLLSLTNDVKILAAKKEIIKLDLDIAKNFFLQQIIKISKLQTEQQLKQQNIESINPQQQEIDAFCNKIEEKIAYQEEENEHMRSQINQVQKLHNDNLDLKIIIQSSLLGKISNIESEIIDLRKQKELLEEKLQSRFNPVKPSTPSILD